MSIFDIDAFVNAYVACAFWSTHGPDEGPYACENLDDLFSDTDLAPECAKAMRADCVDFIEAQKSDLEAYAERMRCEQWSGESRAGHDFWLNRNGHGAGFWDRGLGALGERLSQASKVYGSCDLYPGDDGLIYGA